MPHNSYNDTWSSVYWLSEVDLSVDMPETTCAANNTSKKDPELIGTTNKIHHVTLQCAAPHYWDSELLQVCMAN